MISALIEGRAKKKAIEKIKKAWTKLEQIDVDKMSKAVLEGDKDFWRESYKFQEELDPAMAAVRKGATETLAMMVGPDSMLARRQDQALDQMFSEQLAEDPETTAVIDSLIQRAQTELDAGATFGPELQAEFVRSGLEKGITSGFGVGPDGQVGSNVRELLGTAGEELKAHRLGQATGALSVADSLRQSRAQILGSLIPAAQSVEAQRAQLASGSLQIAHGAMPQVGVHGREVANMLEQNRQFRNQRTMALAGLSAQKRLAEGQMWSDFNQGAHQLAGGVVSMFAMGGLGGAAGGAAGAAGTAGTTSAATTGGAGGFNSGSIQSLIGQFGGASSRPQQ